MIPREPFFLDLGCWGQWGSWVSFKDLSGHEGCAGVVWVESTGGQQALRGSGPGGEGRRLGPAREGRGGGGGGGGGRCGGGA